MPPEHLRQSPLPGNGAPAASARRPHPAPHRRPRRARNSEDPLPGPGFGARRRRPGLLHSIPAARPSRAVSAEPSPLAARGAAAPAPRAPPRRSRPCTPAGSRGRGATRAPPVPRGREAPAPRTSPAAAAAADPPLLLTSRLAQGESGRSPRPQPPPPTSGPASAAPAAAAPAQALEPPPRRASSTPGSRRFPARHAQRARPPCEGARARGREVSGLQAGTRRRRRRRERAMGAWLPPGEGRARGRAPPPAARPARPPARPRVPRPPPGSLPAGETWPPAGVPRTPIAAAAVRFNSARICQARWMLRPT